MPSRPRFELYGKRDRIDPRAERAAATSPSSPPPTPAVTPGSLSPEIINPFTSSGYDIAPGVLFTEAYDGYLLGSKTLIPLHAWSGWSGIFFLLFLI